MGALGIARRLLVKSRASLRRAGCPGKVFAAHRPCSTSRGPMSHSGVPRRQLESPLILLNNGADRRANIAL